MEGGTGFFVWRSVADDNCGATPGGVARGLAAPVPEKVMRAGVLGVVRRKRWFVSKSETRRIERKKALRRMRRKQQRAMSQDGL